MVTLCVQEKTLFHFISNVLNTHDLPETVMKRGSNYLTALFHNNPVLISEVLMRFLTYANRCGVGYWALNYNKALDSYLTSPKLNTQGIITLITNPHTVFGEVYLNERLANKERWIERIQRHMKAVQMAYDEMISTGKITTIDEAITSCKNKFCTQNVDIISAILSQDKIIPKVYTYDQGITFCFDLYALVKSLTVPVADAYINPITSQQYSKEAATFLRSRYADEIAMVQYFMKI
jgi:hypothetical protein